jgi:hypothetical protein
MSNKPIQQGYKIYRIVDHGYLSDSYTRLQLAKQWLRENPLETISTTARIFKVPRSPKVVNRAADNALGR